jgi:hypothetical protein
MLYLRAVQQEDSVLLNQNRKKEGLLSKEQFEKRIAKFK